MRKKPGLIAIGVLFILYTGCHQETASHFHDRHLHSFGPIAEYARKEGLRTLVLLDYHHDSGPGPEFDGQGLASYNWVGHLINQDIITQVYWVSGRNLQKQNRNARRAWLQRKWSLDTPSERRKKEEAIRIVDWPELLEHFQDRKGPFLLSLDLDILTVDSGPSPDAFLEEILGFIEEKSPPLVTVALSAVYQRDAEQAWSWFRRSYKALSRMGPLFLEAGKAAPAPETLEEIAAWERWESDEADANDATGFATGRSLWDYAPASMYRELLANPSLPGDEGSADFLGDLAAAGDSGLLLSGGITQSRLENLRSLASSALAEALRQLPDSDPLPEAGGGMDSQGLLVRFRRETQDRGCLAIYQGVDDLEAAVKNAAVSAAFFDPRYPPVQEAELKDLSCEVAVFGEFLPLERPLDFIPGLHSLIIEDDSGQTLLQAGIATNRDLNRIGFLETLTRKAGLEAGTWKGEGVRFYRAVTLTVTGAVEP